MEVSQRICMKTATLTMLEWSGKTPPRLLEDLCLYNPQLPAPNGYNVLTEPVLPFEEGAPGIKVTAKNACQHIWASKPSQSAPQAAGLQSDLSSFDTVAACCIKCRCHLKLKIDCGGEVSGTLPCPSNEAPLHHFLYKHTTSCGFRHIKEDGKPEAWVDERHFQCSNWACTVRLAVWICCPRLTPEYIALLTDPHLIKQRAQTAMETEPERFEGHAVPSKMQVLTNLRAYISNALNSPDPKMIVGNNKKFLLSLGEPCAEVLEYLGFTRDVICHEPLHASVY